MELQKAFVEVERMIAEGRQSLVGPRPHAATVRRADKGR